MSEIGSANAIIIWKGSVLLFHRDNIPNIPYPDYWSLPGGGIEVGETPKDAVIRELREEVTHSPEVLEEIFHHKLKDNRTLTIFFSKVDDREAVLFKHNPGEGQEIAFIPLPEISNYKIPEFASAVFQSHPDRVSEFVSFEDPKILAELFQNAFS